VRPCIQSAAWARRAGPGWPVTGSSKLALGLFFSQTAGNSYAEARGHGLGVCLVLHHIYNANNSILEKLKKGLTLTKTEELDLKNLPATYLICYLNLFHEAIDRLNEAKIFLKNHSEEIYEIYKDTLRILRKVKYS
jgi:hypothetical protein